MTRSSNCLLVNLKRRSSIGPELQDNEADNASPNLDVKQEDILSTNDRLLPISYHQNDDETPHYPSQIESTSRTAKPSNVERHFPLLDIPNSNEINIMFTMFFCRQTGLH